MKKYISYDQCLNCLRIFRINKYDVRIWEERNHSDDKLCDGEDWVTISKTKFEAHGLPYEYPEGVYP